MLAVTFAIFPLVGLAARALVPGALPPAMWVGIVFLRICPSTVQCAIAFTAIARGNVAVAVCVATLSTFAGVFLTPLLAALTLGVTGASLNPDQALAIAARVLLPAILGQLARLWIAKWATGNDAALKLADQGSILVAIYAAFSASVVGGLWRGITPGTLARLAVVDCAILTLALWGTARIGHLPVFTREDRTSIMFGGTKKSLATGVAIAACCSARRALGQRSCL